MVKVETSSRGKKRTEPASASPEETPVFTKWARGADADKRTAILDCADDVFLEMGFQAASMSVIASRIGGSKGTLYNYFSSKEELFLACVSRHCQGVQEQMRSLSAVGGDVSETLTRLGRRYVELVSSDRLVRRFRMIVAEAERAPELARGFYENGPAQGALILADYLAHAMDAGDLMRADPLRAAHHFFSLCYNRLSKARLCGAAAEPDAETIERDVADAVRIFMAGYAVR